MNSEQNDYKGRTKTAWRLKNIDRESWNYWWSKVNFANLMQSWEYGEAKRVEGWRPRRYLLKDSKGMERGLLQVLAMEKRFIGGIARINRGPVLFVDPHLASLKEPEHLSLWKAIRQELNGKRLWYGLVAPEAIWSEEVVGVFKKNHFSRRKKSVYGGSIRLSVVVDEQELLNNMKGKWRNMLRKAWKSCLDIQTVTLTNKMEELIQLYNMFQVEKGFTGLNESLLRALITRSGPQWQCFALKGMFKEALVGFVLIVEHGDTATYLIGWSSDEGRRRNVNYLLIWNAILHVRENGLKWFDMGGVTTNTPKGIVHFKKGVGGKAYTLVGEYSYSVINNLQDFFKKLFENGK